MSGTQAFFSQSPKRQGQTKALCDLEGLIRALRAYALWCWDTILEVMSTRRTKRTTASAYCIEKVHRLVLVYGEKSALAGMNSL